MKRQPVSGSELARKICEVLGVDPSCVWSINIYCPAHDNAQVTFGYVVQDDKVDELKRVFETYMLAQKGE